MHRHNRLKCPGIRSLVISDGETQSLVNNGVGSEG
jgi:hypothetical protein